MSLETRLIALATRIATEVKGRAPAVHTHLISHLSDSSALGRTLVASPDAPSARTAIDAASFQHQHAEEYAPVEHAHTQTTLQLVPQTYTPILTATTTDPFIGNSILEGRYVLLGKMCWVSIYLFAGSTWTPGSGFYRISLPVPPTTSRHQLLNLHVTQTGERIGDAKIETGSGRIERAYVWDHGTKTFDTLGSATGIAAGNGRLMCSGFYEVA